MKTKKIVMLLSFMGVITILSSCNYSELPPKTDSVTTNYVLPKGERPTAEEQIKLNEIREEYNKSLTK